MASSFSNNNGCCAWISTPVLLLLCIILFQWLLLTILLSRQETMNAALSTLHLGAAHCSLCPSSSSSKANSIQGSLSSFLRTSGKHADPLQQEWQGVAVGLLLRRPKWFYKRYNVMIHNAMVNTPETWAIQLFVHQEWFEKELLEYHRGLKRLIESNHSRIIVTPLPNDLQSLKPKGVLPNKWFWEHVVAEQVLLFHGDGALCSNSKHTWNDFEPYAYVGVPWGAFNKQGGQGTEFSLRKKSAMLAALDYKPYKGGQEDKYFVSTLLDLNKKEGKDVYKIATPQVSQWFAGTEDIVGENNTLREDETYGPMVIAGTQSQLSDEARNWVLGTCPELKVIFPVLHNPHCFGARPNAEKCSFAITGIRPAVGGLMAAERGGDW